MLAFSTYPPPASNFRRTIEIQLRLHFMLRLCRRRTLSVFSVFLMYFSKHKIMLVNTTDIFNTLNNVEKSFFFASDFLTVYLEKKLVQYASALPDIFNMRRTEIIFAVKEGDWSHYVSSK